MAASDLSAPFIHAHASHADWRVAAEQCITQLERRTSRAASLGFVYLTDVLAPYASDILALLKARTGVAEWVGTVGVGICATGVEYLDEPAMAVMLADLPSRSFAVFSGTRPPPLAGQRTASGAIAAHAALVHADPATLELSELLLDMAGKVESGWVFGGLTSSRGPDVQIANETHSGGGEYGGGLSGVVFSSEVHMLARVTQGCYPLASRAGHRITAGEGHMVAMLDGRPALDVLMEEVGVDDPHALARHGRLTGGLFVGLAAADDDGSRFDDYLVRHVVALDPRRGAVGVAGDIHVGQQLMFCTRDTQSARQDLVRICTELRDEVEREAPAFLSSGVPIEVPVALRRIRGALYFSCLGRGASLFGEQGDELNLIRQQLGDIPLVGFYASGEIARHRLYGYTGVLTLFV